MILVAYSSSQKTHWILHQTGSQFIEFRTKGINPFYNHEKEIIKITNTAKAVHPYLDLIREVHFFGAGCSNPDRREVVSNALSFIFKNAFINVENDMLGGAYAVCSKKPGVVSLLGTGSNSAFFNGHKISMERHGIGFILGDEASGTYFGKRLITDFLYGKMPPKLHKAFREAYNLDKATVINYVYKKGSPNLYIASFSIFMGRHKFHPYIKGILHEGFEQFIDTHIIPFKYYLRYPCHFIGSIAYYFSDMLRQVCAEKGIAVGKILVHPVKDLAEFILQQEEAKEAKTQT